MSNDTGGFDSLSERERQVLGMAAAGMLDKQISVELGLSLNTLRTYWTRIRTKLGEHTRAALVAMFVTDEMKGDEGADIPQLAHEGWILDVPTMTMVASDSVNDLHGLQRRVPHPSVEYTRLYHPEDRELTRARIYDVIEGRVENAHIVFRMVVAEGVELVHLTMHSVREASGAVSKVYGYRTRSLDCRKGHDPRVRIGHWERNYPEDRIWIDEDLASIIGLPGQGYVSMAEVGNHFVDNDRQANDELVAKAVREGWEREEHSGRFKRLDGSIVWARVTRRFIKMDDGSTAVHGTIIVFE